MTNKTGDTLPLIPLEILRQRAENAFAEAKEGKGKSIEQLFQEYVK